MPGKEPRYPINTRLGGAQNRNGRSGGEKSSAPTGIRAPDRPVRSLVAKTDCTTLAPLDEIDVCGLDSSGSGQGQVMDRCKRGKVPSLPLTGWEFLG
jgi:hypothetical protein